MLEKVRDKVKKGRVYPCRTRELYDSLLEADKEILMSLLTDFTLSDNSISTALRDQAGIIIADTSIARHRRGFCSCSRI
jgi:hypothetical protein